MIEQLQAARWFGAKNRPIADTRVLDRAPLTASAALRLLEVRYVSGPPDTYVLADELDQPEVAREVLDHFRGATIPTERGGTLVFRPTAVLGSVRRDRLEPISLLRGEQSNTSIRFGDSLILKLFRRLEYGPNPDVEVGLFLTEHTTFRGTPPVAGTLEYVSPDRGSASVALLQGFEPNRGDAWTTTLARVREVVDGNTRIIASVSALGQLGETTAHLHLALASGSGDFGPEPITARDIETWRTAIHQEVRAAAEALHQRGLPVDVDALLQRADGIDALAGSLKARHHGDYHLGQVLERPDGSFVIIDFEGEPAKPLVLRREKRSPLRDVAGMLRSFDYARHAAGREAPRAEEWYRAARAAFLGGYTASIAAYPGLVPPMLEAPLAALELEKAAYEALYELNNRPDWIAIPLAALRTRG